MVIIGLDFGNFNSYTSYINHFDTNNRMSGEPRELLPSYTDGIPSVYYCSPTGKVSVCEDAVRDTATPLSNRLRYLKRNIGKTVKLLDSKKEKTIEINYDEAITAVVQSVVRTADEYLTRNFQLSSNLVSLAYPANFTVAQRRRLIDLVEKATLANGTKIKVYGTISEPAAAALDYLSDENTPKKDMNVLTYDLGGGTFDVALVSAYPKGRKDNQGNIYYNDIIDADGIKDIGGYEFDGVVYDIIKEQIPVPIKGRRIYKLKEKSREIKERLTKVGPNDEINSIFEVGDDEYRFTVSRKEFERKSYHLLKQTIDKTIQFLNRHKDQKPDLILLAGGASQMPMVKEALEKALPEYRGKVKSFRPAMAISFGAARFGTIEKNDDPAKHTIVKRLNYDLGIKYVNGENDKNGFIKVLAKAGDKLPLNNSCTGLTVSKGLTRTTYNVFEAKGDNADIYKVSSDWTHVVVCEVLYGREMPKGSKSEAIINIDRNGLLKIQARDLTKPDAPYFKNEIVLKNLS